MEKSIRILLIDDDKAAHIYHKLMLEELGIDLNQIKSFTTVSEAVGHLQSIITKKDSSKWPTFIFLDLHMPGRTGFDFIRDYENMKHNYKHPKIYFVSNSVSKEDSLRIQKMKSVVTLERKFLEKDILSSILKIPK